jgi:hypothetical protein
MSRCEFDEVSLDHSDFDVPSMSSASDSWEALYRRERRLRLSLQEKLASLGDNTAISRDSERPHGSKLHGVIDEDIESEDFDNLDIKQSGSFFLSGKDDYGLLSSSSPALMFGDESAEKVDLLALAALNDKEKETTDDEGDHVPDIEEDAPSAITTGEQLTSTNDRSQTNFASGDDEESTKEIIMKQQKVRNVVPRIAIINNFSFDECDRCVCDLILTGN